MTTNTTGRLYARRYAWRGANPALNTELLEKLHETCPRESLEDSYLFYSSILGDSRNVIWTTHDGPTLTGGIMLTKVVPNVEANLLFLFFDRNLVGKRTLLRNIIGLCFTEFGLNRVGMEVPEGVKLERFARRLGFGYEGEGRPRNPELPASLADSWVAKQGSRIEQAHWTGSEWKDLIRLRVLASEWVGTGE